MKGLINKAFGAEELYIDQFSRFVTIGQVRIRQAGLQLLQDALEGSGGGGPTAAYVEAIRMIFKVGLNDKSATVRTAAAGCLRAVALTGGPGVASGGLEACINLCLKVLAELCSFARLHVKGLTLSRIVCVKKVPFSSRGWRMCIKVFGMVMPLL